jgi:endonuclease/exonuclease/phosphatase family metal-dependent hydrolase
MIVRILQWNTWYKEASSNLVRVIKQTDPDIACLQEIATFSPNETDVPQLISNSLNNADFNYKQAQRWQSDSGITSQGNAIFSKFPIEKSFYKYLQDEIPNPEKYDEEGRIYVEITVNIDDKKLTLGTTHLSYAPQFVDSPAKNSEIDRLISIINQKSKNYILTGDFNSTPDTNVIKKIEKYLVNCGPDYSQKTWTTKQFDYEGFREDKLNWRIDYAFASKDIKIISSQLVQTAYSDHLPLLIEIEV